LVTQGKQPECTVFENFECQLDDAWLADLGNKKAFETNFGKCFSDRNIKDAFKKYVGDNDPAEWLSSCAFERVFKSEKENKKAFVFDGNEEEVQEVANHYMSFVDAKLVDYKRSRAVVAETANALAADMHAPLQAVSPASDLEGGCDSEAEEQQRTSYMQPAMTAQQDNKPGEAASSSSSSSTSSIPADDDLLPAPASEAENA
jgi:hypothetical protein